jgi:hypothetical protein
MKFEKGQLVMAYDDQEWMPAIYLHPVGNVYFKALGQARRHHVLWSIKDSVRRWAKTQDIKSIDDPRYWRKEVRGE